MSDSCVAVALKYKYDVFISFKSDYDEVIARQIHRALSKKNLRVIAGWEDKAFPGGQTTFESLAKCVEQSARTLVILTTQSIRSNWVLLELLQAIEQSKHCNILTLRLLLHKVKEQDIKILKCGMLAEVPHFTLDVNRNDWCEILLQNIKNEVPLSSILSVGSGLAHGLVFSHYVGFLSYVLPEFTNIIKGSSTYQNEQLHISQKYYLLLPGSCQILDNLESSDDESSIQIKKQESIMQEWEHAGKPRKAKLQIYKITKNKECFYFIADYPHVLKAICQLDELNQADKRFQIAKFYYILNEVVNHAENQGCYDTVRMVLFNEEVESMQSALFDCLKNDVPDQILKEWVSPVHRLMSSTDNEWDVTVSFLQEQQRDVEVANEINEFLRKKNLKVYFPPHGGGTHFNLPSSKWHIFVLSRETIHSENAVKRLCFGTLYECLDRNLLKVLPVVVDIQPEDVPRVIKCVTVVNSKEPNYCQQLLTTIKGGNITMEQTLPAGDVATGLAWAYVINYLRITLMKKTEDGLNFGDRIKQCLIKKGVTCGCIYKMFVIIPKSCVVESDLVDKANKVTTFAESGHYKIEKVDRLEPVYENTGGQLGRPFYLHMYNYTDCDNKSEICFLAEYSTPHNCLREMAYTYPFAGLKKEDMCAQGAHIVDLVPQILRHETVKRKYGDMTELLEFVYYDDEVESLMSALRRHIRNQSRFVDGFT